jgi:hypothetical protein|tara:strand:+ start:131 stop:655 length:525 start_codon:yes stop_codon:yes gene_type:complete
MMARKKVTTNFKTRKRNGITYMICRNSIEDKSYWGWQTLSKHARCNEWSEVGEGATAVLCHKCVNKTVGPPEMKGGYKSTGRMRGWQFMKEFVDVQGNVFHKGKEQPKLKGTLKPTEPKPTKKKLSKLEKGELRDKILEQMGMVRGDLKNAKFKKDIRSGSVLMRKLQRQLKKL